LARRNATHCFIGGPKHRKQPERYVQWVLKFCKKNIDINKKYGIMINALKNIEKENFMKKLLFVLMVLGMVATTTWAQNGTGFSLGGGAFIGTDFGGGFENQILLGPQSVTVSLPMPYFGGGGYVFFDAMYIEASVGLLFGGGKWEMKAGSPLNITEDVGDFKFTSINLGLLGKYPVTLSPKVKLFPLVGFDYQIVASASLDSEDANDPDDWNQFWFKLGGGFDYSINNSLFFRIEALYGLRFASKGEENYADGMKAAYQDLFYQQYGIIPGVTSDTLLGHGLTARIAIGYKF
jgi:hypothetical protein